MAGEGVGGRKKIKFRAKMRREEAGLFPGGWGNFMGRKKLRRCCAGDFQPDMTFIPTRWPSLPPPHSKVGGG